MSYQVTLCNGVNSLKQTFNTGDYGILSGEIIFLHAFDYPWNRFITTHFFKMKAILTLLLISVVLGKFSYTDKCYRFKKQDDGHRSIWYYF